MSLSVPSPCIGICTIRESDQRCAGCERTLDEIARWSRMDADTQMAVLDEIRLHRRPSGASSPSGDAAGAADATEDSREPPTPAG